MRFWYLFSVILLFCSCKTLAPNKSTVSDSEGIKADLSAPLDCKNDQSSTFFALKSIGLDIENQMLGVSESIVVSDASSVRNIRLDFCVDEATNEWELKRMFRIYTHVRGGTLLEGIKVNTDVDISQLKNIDWSGADQDKINLIVAGNTIAGRNNGPVKFRIKGFQKDGKKFVAVYKVDHETEMPMAYENVTFGEFVYGDIPQSDECEFGSVLKQSGKKLQIGTATFSFKYCARRMGEGGVGYDIVSLTVKDDDESLLQDSGKEITLSKAEIQKRLKIDTGHHNSCDDFSLEMPHATYGVTALMGTNFGNCVPFHAAPGQPKETTKTMKYRFKYEGRDWIEGEVTQDCQHFLCPLPKPHEV